MTGLHLLLILGCVLSASVQDEPARAAFPSCFCHSLPPVHSDRSYCFGSYNGAPFVCPIYSELEMSFFKSEPEIRELAKQGVQVNKPPPGTRINFRRKAKPPMSGNKTEETLGCGNYVQVTFSANAVVFDETTNEEYRLVDVPSDCGGPLYQPVLLGGCYNDKCCPSGKTGNCTEIVQLFDYLVYQKNSTVKTKVVKFNVPVTCRCRNIS